MEAAVSGQYQGVRIGHCCATAIEHGRKNVLHYSIPTKGRVVGGFCELLGTRSLAEDDAEICSVICALGSQYHKYTYEVAGTSWTISSADKAT